MRSTPDETSASLRIMPLRFGQTRGKEAHDVLITYLERVATPSLFATLLYIHFFNSFPTSVAIHGLALHPLFFRARSRLP